MVNKTSDLCHFYSGNVLIQVFQRQYLDRRIIKISYHQEFIKYFRVEHIESWMAENSFIFQFLLRWRLKEIQLLFPVEYCHKFCYISIYRSCLNFDLVVTVDCVKYK